MSQTSWIRIETLLLVAVLSACGGGGGGGGGVTGAAGAGVAAADTGTARVSGQVSYDAVPNPTGALDYASTASLPVRGAAVDALDAASDEILASTQTDDGGTYSMPVALGRAVTIRVRAQSGGTGSGIPWDVSVRDNTRGDAVYAIESPPFVIDSNSVTRDLHAASGWSGTGYGALRAAAPFALLDTIRRCIDKVIATAPASQFPSLRVFWSVNNVPAYGDTALGQIGTTSSTHDADGSMIYVLGKENNDTDEYDASVIAHEWAHYYQAAFSRDDSPGGAHAMGESVEARLAFSEGWGNAWSGIALGRANYTDALGALQSRGVNVDLSAGPTGVRGWFREASIHSILWQLNARNGFIPIHAAMTGALRATPALTDIHAFAAAVYASAPGAAPVLAGLMAAQNISSAANDPFGAAETNNGGQVSALPLYRTAAFGAVTRACVSNAFGSYNKLGSFVYLRVEVPTAGSHAIRIDGPAGADPDVSAYSGRFLGRSENLGTSEAATFNLPAGTTVLAVNDANDLSASTCFNVTIN